MNMADLSRDALQARARSLGDFRHHQRLVLGIMIGAPL
jgi:hypothetical protein